LANPSNELPNFWHSHLCEKRNIGHKAKIKRIVFFTESNLIAILIFPIQDMHPEIKYSLIEFRINENI
jgi:hypothetical protein